MRDVYAWIDPFGEIERLERRLNPLPTDYPLPGRLYPEDFGFPTHLQTPAVTCEELRADPAAFARWAGFAAEPWQEAALRRLEGAPSFPVGSYRAPIVDELARLARQRLLDQAVRNVGQKFSLVWPRPPVVGPIVAKEVRAEFARLAAAR